MNETKKASAKSIKQAKRARSRAIARILVRGAKLRLKGDSKAMMEAVAEGLISLGGIYIKFLQIVMLDHPLLRSWKSEHRLNIFENVEYEKIDIASHLKSVASTDFYNLVAKISPMPFAAGSFGQVYSAVGSQGQELIVKVLRTEASEMLEHDIKQIKRVRRLLQTSMTSWEGNMKSVINNFVITTRDEANYIKEINNAKILEASNLERLYDVPHTYIEACNSYVIVQGRLGGISAAKVLKIMEAEGRSAAEIVMTETGSDITKTLSEFGYAINRQMFMGHPVHGDLHPGNVRFLPNNRVGILDFGILAFPPSRRRAHLELSASYWRAAVNRRLDLGEHFMLSMRLYSRDLYYSIDRISKYCTSKLGKTVNLVEVCGTYVARLAEGEIGKETLKRYSEEMRFGELLHMVVNKGNRFGLEVKVDEMSWVRTYGSFINMVNALGEREIFRELDRMLLGDLDAFRSEIQDDTPVMPLSSAFIVMNEWLERIASKDPLLFSNISTKIREALG